MYRRDKKPFLVFSLVQNSRDSVSTEPSPASQKIKNPNVTP
jgi:hypothetical protein